MAADTIYQGTSSNIVYAVKMELSAMTSATVNNIQYTLSGTQDADDLPYTTVYFNATSPVISGATYLGQTVATFAAPHTYSININKIMAAASSGYFLITINVSSTATDNKTVRITGNTNPVVFAYNTAPNVTNSQTNGAGTQTIQAAEITLTSSVIGAGNIVRGSNTNIIYAAKMDVSAMTGVTVNNIQYTLTGTHDADDLPYTTVYFNATAPIITGATYLGQTVATFAAPHTYSININRAIAAASSGYFIITVNVSATATLGNTVQVNGATNPVVFGYTTAPNITNSQTNAAGVKTISASGPAPFSASGNMNQNSVAEKLIVIKSVYPNPVNSILHVQVKGVVRLIITNQQGNVMAQKTITENGSIDMRKYMPGAYIIKDINSGYTVTVVKE